MALDTINWDTNFAQIGVYNAACSDYAMGMDTGNSDNSPALKAAITDALNGTGAKHGANNGGLVLIPAGTYTCASAISLDANNYPDKGVIIQGTGGGAELLFTADNVDFIQLFNFNSGRGIRFKNIRFTFASDLMTGGFAIYTANCQNVSCEEVYFYNCPGAFFADNNSLQCGLTNCTIDYNLLIDDKTMVELDGSQCYVRDCVMRQHGAGASPPGPTGCFGIKIGSVSTSFVSGCHISEFDTGIHIGKNAVEAYFSDCRVNAFTQAVTFNPDTGSINGVFFSDCTFYLSQYSINQSAGIYVDTNAENDSNVADIIFNNCVVYGWYGPGLHINAGKNIVITGGSYSGNGLDPQSGDFGAGIEITGGQHISIAGAQCMEVDQHNGSGHQPYGIAISTTSSSTEAPTDIVIAACTMLNNTTNGILISGESSTHPPTNIFVSNCDVTGYSAYSSAISVTGTVTNLQITNCAGYNDQGVHVSTGLGPTSGANFNGATFGYYGPITFYAWQSTSPITQIAVQGINTHLTSGTFIVAPGSTAHASITYTGSQIGLGLLVIGQ